MDAMISFGDQIFKAIAFIGADMGCELDDRGGSFR
jgi:hypothetical protein